MTDDRAQLRNMLDQLRSQLDAASTLDPQLADRLRATVADIERAAFDRQPLAAQETSLSERVSEAALDFEASHPTLAGTLGSVIDALGRMGI